MKNVEKSKKNYLVMSMMALMVSSLSTSIMATPEGNYVIKYDAQNETEYFQKWANIYGPLELAAGGTLSVSKHEATVSAVPFHVGADFSVFDHLKYIAVSTEEFSVPDNGSLEFSVDILAHTPGTEPDRLILGCYGPAFSYPDLELLPCLLPLLINCSR